MENLCKILFGYLFNKLIFSALKNLPSRIIPIVWFNVSVSFDPSTRDQLLQLFHIRERTFIGGIISFGLFISSLIGIISLVALHYLRDQVRSYANLWKDLNFSLMKWDIACCLAKRTRMNRQTAIQMKRLFLMPRWF
jgi:hypothetical protein